MAIPLSAEPFGRIALAGLRESLQPVPRIEAARPRLRGLDERAPLERPTYREAA